MRLTFVSRLVCCGYAAIAWSAPQAKSPVDEMVDALFRVRQITDVSISPDGARVVWVQSQEDPLTGAESLSIYTHDNHPGGAATRVTAGKGAAEFHENSVAWSPDGRRLAFLSD